MLPSVDEIEAYVRSAEVYVLSAVYAVAPELPHVREAAGRLWEDVARHAPAGLTEIRKHVPGLGTFELPPPPPPPPARGLLERGTRWVGAHRALALAIGTSTVGAGLLVGYATVQTRRHARLFRARAAASGERRQVVVVLGADHPLALPLLLDFESEGYIVIASADSAEACQEIESRCHGYVRVLPLDPSDPESVPVFLRSLVSAMSRRFPIHVAGDPHVAPGAQPYIHALVSLLALPGASRAAAPPPPAPLEHAPLDTPYMQATHVAPLQVLQALLPLLRARRGARSVVVCVPAGVAAFAGVRAMSAAATRTALDVLRAELAAAGAGAVRVTTVDVGAVGAAALADVHAPTDAWTPSERATYGPAFASALAKTGASRRTTHPSVFVRAVVDAVSAYRPRGAPTVLGLALWRARGWLRRERVVVGAGARTYGLPPALLDALLRLPELLVQLRNALLPLQPWVRAPSPRRTRSPRGSPPAAQQRMRIEAAPSENEGSSAPVSDVEADVESNGEQDERASEGAASGVADSWVAVDEA